MISWLVTGAIAALVIIGLLAPLDSLQWWARHGRRGALGRTSPAVAAATPNPDEDVAAPDHCVVYLSGVGLLDTNVIPPDEAWFCDRLREVTDLPVISDVFPYAADNRGLLQRASAWFWRVMGHLQANPRTVGLSAAIQLRNVQQVLVSADPRYGPSYHAGLTHQVWQALGRAGYRAGSGVPVTVIGYSGGAQMALGVAWFLAAAEVPVTIISIGGVHSGDPGFARVERFWDLRGGRDRLRLLGPIAFPTRWGIARTSPWNRARREGRVTVVDAGADVSHFGDGYYFDRETRHADGRTNADCLIDAVVELLGRPRA